jgi:Ca-activated chloride channel family protein
MTRAAAMGRGSNISIGKLAEVQEKMTELFTMLEQPAVTDLALKGEHILEMLPAPLPDLYLGEPLVALLRSRKDVKNLQLSGLQFGNIPWLANIDAAGAVERPGIAVLWARKKIRMAMDSLSAGADPKQVKKEVTSIALKNHLVSRYTSLVAVEQKISRPNGTDLQSRRQKTNLPAGWQYDKVFAGNAATATPAALLLLLGLSFLMLTAMAAALQWRRR